MRGVYEMRIMGQVYPWISRGYMVKNDQTICKLGGLRDDLTWTVFTSNSTSVRLGTG